MSSADSRKLIIGPANYAGQGHRWAQAVFAHLEVDSRSFVRERRLVDRLRGHAFDFEVDDVIGSRRRSRDRWLAKQVLGASHLALDGFMPVLGNVAAALTEAELRSLAEMVPKVALIAHGTDIRDPDMHASRLPWSYYSQPSNASWVDAARVRAASNRSLARTMAFPVFVSTPDLLLDMPQASWLPVVVNPLKWRCERGIDLKFRRSVLFRPSTSLKGSSDVAPTLERLSADGRLQAITAGKVKHAEMPSIVKSADVVVDQLRTGSYGVAAVEAMAAGRLVIGHVAEDVQELMPEAPPIVSCEPHRFGEVLEQVLGDPEPYEALAAKGPAFVERWHNGEASARSLRAFVLP